VGMPAAMAAAVHLQLARLLAAHHLGVTLP
jgi:hypothetical protein